MEVLIIEHVAGSVITLNSIQVLGVQTVGSSGAARLGAELLKRCYCSSSSWAGHVLLSSPCDGVYTMSIVMKVPGKSSLRLQVKIKLNLFNSWEKWKRNAKHFKL